MEKMLVAAVCGLITLVALGTRKPQGPRVMINQIVSHPALDAVVAGVREELSKRSPDVVITVANAQGNIATAAQIAKQHAATNPDAIVAIATPSAQASLKAYDPKRTILAFGAVSDPEAAGLTGGDRVLGVMDSPPVEDLITIMAKALPGKTRIGIVHNPGEVNSVKTVERFTKAAQAKGWSVVVTAATTTANVKLATQGLVDRVDVIYLPLDNLVFSALESVTMTALAAKIPVVGNEPTALDRGFLLALGFDYHQSGVQLGAMLADTLEGKPVQPRIQAGKLRQYRVNDDVAKKLALSPIALKEAHRE